MESSDSALLEMIKDLPGLETEPASAPEASADPAPEVTPAETPAESQAAPAEAASAVDDVVALRAQLDVYKQIIASDPVKQAAYYGVSPVQQQAPAPQQAEVAPAELPEAELFGEEGFDPYNAKHQLKLLQYNEQQKQQTVAAQQVESQNEQLLNQMDQQVLSAAEENMPGIKTLYEKPYEQLSDNEQTVRDKAEKLFTRKMYEKFPPNQLGPDGKPFNPVWLSPVAHREVMQSISGNVKTLSASLGLGLPAPQGNPQAAEVARREMHVETSNAVPVDNSSDFEKAEAKNDLLGMVRAIF